MDCEQMIQMFNDNCHKQHLYSMGMTLDPRFAAVNEFKKCNCLLLSKEINLCIKDMKDIERERERDSQIRERDKRER